MMTFKVNKVRKLQVESPPEEQGDEIENQKIKKIVIQESAWRIG